MYWDIYKYREKCVYITKKGCQIIKMNKHLMTAPSIIKIGHQNCKMWFPRQIFAALDIFIWNVFIHSFPFFYFTGRSTLKVFCLCKTLWKHCICMAMNGYVIASYNRFVNGSLKRNCSIDRHSAWNLLGSMAKCGTRYKNKISPANPK